jgi:hypothetical protein
MRWMMLSLAAGALALSGCAAMPGSTGSEIDYVKVARIENAARAVGVNVYWLNYPRKYESSIN